MSTIPATTAAATNQQVSAVPVYTTLNTPHPNPSGVGPDDDVEIGLVQPTTQIAQSIKKTHWHASKQSQGVSFHMHH